MFYCANVKIPGSVVWPIKANGNLFLREFFKESNDIILYLSNLGNVAIKVTYFRESFWLTQKTIAELLGVEIPALSKHLKHIFESGELDESSVVSKMETTAADGKNYLTEKEKGDLSAKSMCSSVSGQWNSTKRAGR